VAKVRKWTRAQSVTMLQYQAKNIQITTYLVEHKLMSTGPSMAYSQKNKCITKRKKVK